MLVVVSLRLAVEVSHRVIVSDGAYFLALCMLHCEVRVRYRGKVGDKDKQSVRALLSLLR